MSKHQQYSKTTKKEHHIYKNKHILPEGLYTGLVDEILKNGKISLLV